MCDLSILKWKSEILRGGRKHKILTCNGLECAWVSYHCSLWGESGYGPENDPLQELYRPFFIRLTLFCLSLFYKIPHGAPVKCCCIKILCKVKKILKDTRDLITSPSRSHDHLNFLFYFFLQNIEQYFAFTPQTNFPIHNLNFLWSWRWWDQIQATS